MKLREHLKLCHQGRRSWPPTWISIIGLARSPTGEIGVLKEAYLSLVSKTRIFLIVEHNGGRYIGFIDVDDERFSRELLQIFQQHYDETIEQIGDLRIT